MVNEIYNIAHSGLSDMVSARAATNILNKALKSEGYNKTNLDYPQAKEILQGYVFEELRNILPSQGVKRQIRNILKTISEELPSTPSPKDIEQSIVKTGLVSEPEVTEPEPAVAIAEASDSYVEEVKSVFEQASEPAQETDDSDFDSLFVYDNQPQKELEEAVVETYAVDKKYDDISDDLFEAISTQTDIIDEEELDKVEEVEAKTTQKKPINRERLKESVDFSAIEISDLENLVQNFSLIEEARAVAIVSTSGKLIDSRGRGFDLDKLASLSNMALMLLEKSGKIRSYHLSVDSSQLFLFPVAEHFIVVIGSQDINFGEVISIFANFEEAV